MPAGINEETIEYKIGFSEQIRPLLLTFNKEKNASYPYPAIVRADVETCSIALKTFVLENEYLKLAISPFFGGRVISIYDKISKIDLLTQPEIITQTVSDWGFVVETGLMRNSLFLEETAYKIEQPGDEADFAGVRFHYFDPVKQVSAEVGYLLYSGSRMLITDVRLYNYSAIYININIKTKIVTPFDSVIMDSFRAKNDTFCQFASVMSEKENKSITIVPERYTTGYVATEDFPLTESKQVIYHSKVTLSPHQLYSTFTHFYVSEAVSPILANENGILEAIVNEKGTVVKFHPSRIELNAEFAVKQPDGSYQTTIINAYPEHPAGVQINDELLITNYKLRTDNQDKKAPFESSPNSPFDSPSSSPFEGGVGGCVSGSQSIGMDTAGLHQIHQAPTPTLPANGEGEINHTDESSHHSPFEGGVGGCESNYEFKIINSEGRTLLDSVKPAYTQPIDIEPEQIINWQKHKDNPYQLKALAQQTRFANIAYYCLAEYEIKQGNLEQAETYLMEAKCYNAGDLRAIILLSALYRRQEEYEAANDELLQVHALFPDEPLLRTEAYLSARSQTGESPVNLLKTRGADIQILLSAVDFYFNANLTDDALQLLNTAKSLYPDNALIIYLIGYCLSLNPKLINTAMDSFVLASRKSSEGIAPFREIEINALATAIRYNPNDKTANELLSRYQNQQTELNGGNL